MLTMKEKVDQFKRELKSMHYYQAKLLELQDELIRLDRMMHEPRPQRITETKGNPINYLDLMEQEQQVRLEYDLLHTLITRVYDKLEQLEEHDRHMLLDLYVKGYSFEKISMENYMSVRNMKYKVDSLIKSIM